MKRITTLALIFLALLTACSKQGDPPKISRYTLEPQSIYQLEDATLHWQVTGATRVVIEASHGNGVGAVESEGLLTVSPRESVTYTLHASNAFGVSRKALELRVLPYGHPQVRIVEHGALTSAKEVVAGREYALVFTIPVRPPSSSQVDAVRVKQGDAVLAQLQDSGDLGDGDEVLGDGLYSGRRDWRFDTPGDANLTFEVTIDGTTHEVPYTLRVLQTNEDAVRTVLEAHAALEAALALFVATTADEARAFALAYLETHRDDLGIDRVEVEGERLIVHYASGMQSHLHIQATPGEGGVVRGGDPANHTDGAARERSAHRRTVSVPALTTSAAAPSVSHFASSRDIGSRSALIWAPHASQFAPFDESAALETLLLEAPLGFDVTLLQDAAADVASLAKLSDYGFVVLAAHGFKGAWLVTGEVASLHHAKRHALELGSGRMSVHQTMILDNEGRVHSHPPAYAVHASWFDAHLSGAFPQSLIVNAGCGVLDEPPLWTSFRSRGAGAYLGFSGSVSSRFAHEQVLELVRQLAFELASVGDGLSSASDPYHQAASRWQLWGESELRFFTGPINLSFEQGLTGWKVKGDGRAITQLGLAPHTQTPTHGSKMAIISTGLGFTDTLGMIQQTFRVPESASTLSFDWNFLSEEFLEFIGSEFQDRLTVSLLSAESDEEVLLDLAIDKVAAKFGARYCESEIERCEAERGQLIRGWDFDTGVQYLKFDVGDVWYTGWQRFEAFDISRFRGQRVTLRFLATDVSDDVLDTAVLIDNIRIE